MYFKIRNYNNPWLGIYVYQAYSFQYGSFQLTVSEAYNTGSHHHILDLEFLMLIECFSCLVSLIRIPNFGQNVEQKFISFFVSFSTSSLRNLFRRMRYQHKSLFPVYAEFCRSNLFYETFKKECNNSFMYLNAYITSSQEQFFKKTCAGDEFDV